MADLNATVGFAYSGNGLKQAQADLRRTTSEGKKTAQAMDMVEREMQQAGQAAATSSRQMSMGGRALQRLGISAGQARAGLGMVPLQLQDIFVQLEMGVPITRTLGQQLPQLAGAFGGMAGAVGLAVGAAISFAPLLFDIGDAGEDAGDGAMTAAKAIKELKDEAQEAEDKVRLLRLGLSSLAEEAVVNEIRSVELAMETLKATAAEATISGPGQLGSAAFNNEIAELMRRRSQLQEILDRFRSRPGQDTTPDDTAGMGSLVTGKASGRNQRFFEQSAARVAATREEIQERTQLQEQAQKNMSRVYAEASRRFIEEEKKKSQIFEDITNSMEKSFERAFSSIIDGSKSAGAAFKDMANSIISDIARMVIKQSVTGPIGKFLGTAISGFFSGGSGVQVYEPGTVGPFLPSAKGNVFGPGGVHAFAKGGVVNGPTVFPFANGTGLMGEAGPEAIMPLKRGPGGRLGVEGGGQVVNVNVINETGGEVETRQDGPNVEVLIKRAVAQDIKGGGTVYNAISKTFNIRPETVRRA